MTSVRITLFALGLASSIGLGQAAQANQYVNDSGTTLNYHVHCYPGGHSNYVLGPGQSIDISCSNGMPPSVHVLPYTYYYGSAPVPQPYYGVPHGVWIPPYWNGQYLVPGHWS